MLSVSDLTVFAKIFGAMKANADIGNAVQFATILKSSYGNL